MDLNSLNSFEDSLILKFNSLPALKNLDLMEKGKFVGMLLQRRFHSLAFTPIYDVAIEGIGNEEAKKVVRAILREEYPAKNPSHREDLVKDLMAIGISKEEILNSSPSRETLSALEGVFSLLKMSEPQELYNVKALTVLRLWGEILVSEEYSNFVEKLAKLGLSKEKSRFYWPHCLHDKKKAALNDFKGEKRTHSDRLTKILQHALISREKIELCANTEQKIFRMKEIFYSQFL